MAKEHFEYPETAKVFSLLEATSQHSGVSRGQAFEDFLTMSVCALSGGQMETQYLETVQKHTSGKPGKRGCDSLAQMFGELVTAMEQDTRDEMKDILGDLFQGAITYGERGQYLTPMPLCKAMARMTIGRPPESGEEHHESPLEPGVWTDDHAAAPAAVSAAVEREAMPFLPSERRRVCDPCCGSGRMLLAAAEVNRRFEFVGQDIDLRCVRMTALNLAFRNLYGYVIWGNSLALEKKLVFRTGFNGRGFVREVPIESCPAPVRQLATEPTTATQPGEKPDVPKSQLRLF